MSFFTQAWNHYQNSKSLQFVFYGLWLWFLYSVKSKNKGVKMDVKVGSEADLKAEAVNGKLQLSAQYQGVDLSAGAFIAATPAQLVTALAKLIPGDSAAEHAALAVVLGALDLAVKAA